MCVWEIGILNLEFIWDLELGIWTFAWQTFPLDARYNSSYTSKMKTAISIPDSVFHAAEYVAKQLSLSRSELYSRAVKAFVDAHGSANVTDKLNEVYSENPSALDAKVTEMQGLSLPDDRW